MFLLKVIHWAMKADTGAVIEAFVGILLFLTVLMNRSEIEAFGKNEQVRNVFRAFFTSITGPILTPVVDPATASKTSG